MCTAEVGVPCDVTVCMFVCIYVDVIVYAVWPLTSSSQGRSSLFPIEDSLLDDGHGNQGVPGLDTNCYPHPNGERIERFSRKVFVGGLPPDIDEGERRKSITQSC